MSSSKGSGGSRRPRYSDEFKADAVALVIDGEPTRVLPVIQFDHVGVTFGDDVFGAKLGPAGGVPAGLVVGLSVGWSRCRGGGQSAVTSVMAARAEVSSTMDLRAA